MIDRRFKALTDNKISKVNLEFQFIRDSHFEDLSAALKGNTVATQLILGRNDFSDLYAGKLVEVLQGNPNITYLDLSANYTNYQYRSIICGDGNEDFTSALQKNSTLTHLILDNNRITDDQAGKLIEKLQGNSTLLHLSLGYNNLKNLASLAVALQNNSSITTLHLYNNNIDTTGAENLSKALQVNTTLTELYLRSNMIGDIGAKKLAESLKGNSNLVSLNLECNGIKATGAEALDELVLSNKNIICAYYENMSEETEDLLYDRDQLVSALANNWIDYKDNDTPLPEGIDLYATYCNAIKYLLKGKLLRPELAATFDEDWENREASKEGQVEVDILSREGEAKDDESEKGKTEKSYFIKTLSYLVIGGIAGGLLGYVLRAGTSLPKDSLIGKLIIPASAIIGITLGGYFAISDGEMRSQSSGLERK